MGAAISCLALNLCECAACMACSCCTHLIQATLSQAARFSHVLILLTTFTLAIILGKSYIDDINGYNYYTKIDLSLSCDSSYEDSCMYRQLIYRASFALALLYGLLAVVTYFSDYVNKGLWIMKYGFAIGLFIAFWWGSNDFFSGWAETARVISFLWLLIQGLLLIDFSHDAHDILMNSSSANGEDNTPYGMYLALSFICFFLAILGLVYLFLNYTGCDLGMFFTVFTLIVGVITTLISLLDSVNKGLLTPSIVFAYSVFMCWYALLSNPDESCNPTANNVSGSQVSN
jgi:serine incorporator 1/3